MSELTDDRLHFIVAHWHDDQWFHLAGPAKLESLKRVLPGWIERFPSARIVTAPLRAATSTSTEAVGVKVKLLVWREMLRNADAPRMWTAKGPFNIFHLLEKPEGKWELFSGYFGSAADGMPKIFPSRDEAVAAAQAIQDRLVLSALEPTPSTPKVTTDDPLQNDDWRVRPVDGHGWIRCNTANLMNSAMTWLSVGGSVIIEQWGDAKE